MSDIEAEKTPAEPSEAHPALTPAKVGVKDTGHIVGTTAGQAVDGRIADLADGD